MTGRDEWTDWHLTPRGWEKGSEESEKEGHVVRPIPTDRVQTYRYSEYMFSAFSPVTTFLKMVWESPDKETVESLRESFGKPPTVIS